MAHQLQEWFAGAIPNTEAERYLRQHEPGWFLVRESASTAGQLVLQIRSDNSPRGIKAFRIQSEQHEGYAHFYIDRVRHGGCRRLAVVRARARAVAVARDALVAGCAATFEQAAPALPPAHAPLTWLLGRGSRRASAAGDQVCVD